MAIKLSTKVGGNGGLIFPYGVFTASDIDMKTAINTTVDATVAGFKTAWDTSRSHLSIETASITAASDTTEQTIIDVSDSGVLTHVIAPSLSATGTMTIRVTIDGEVKTYTSDSISTGATTLRVCLGGFWGTGSQVTLGNATAMGGGADSGWATSSSNAESVVVLTPVQAIRLFGIGLKFESSLKVTVQGSVNLSSTTGQNEGYVAYSSQIPQGV